ncbi:xanthine dehydrogenase family protein molybdopterin-binding subunit [Sphingomonas montana]|uniref:xanthine dehydrogenase family protein molybdopterin-binding subunit n=1 Tax=Sphingomonas montana TaxID=1843236 RepID=UPI00096E25BB|nr:xanthine dehydrogenase family protein molybdopterin-binding subunit [Sphingomonas montana]
MATKYDDAPIGIGSPLSRVDGKMKVTGGARYAAEHPVADLLYGVVVSGAIAKGRITKLHTDAARAAPGVVEVVSHLNRPHIAWFDKAYQDQVAPPGSPFRAFYDAEILYSGQPIALVVARTFEDARHGASLVQAEYAVEPHQTDFERSPEYKPKKTRDTFVEPTNRGDEAAAFAAASNKVDVSYYIGTEHHNPMEMHATTVQWHGDGRITVYDKTQGSQNVQAYLVGVFGFAKKNVRVMNPYVGGGFGSGLRPQYQVYLATLAAKMLERSVRVVLTRQQMFSFTHRSECRHTIRLGANDDGALQSIYSKAVTPTSRFEDYMEPIANWGGQAYRCDNATMDWAITAIDTYTPGDMRAPGAATGMTLFEMALDEMAYETGVDPLAMRLTNYSDRDEMNDIPYTSKALREAYREGAEAFGWADRGRAPRSMRDGTELVGWGVATGIWDAMFQKTSVRARLTANGHLEVATAGSDIGTGTYTVMTQVAAGALGLPAEQVTAVLGDSDLPPSPIEGGSWTAASTGAAVQVACDAVRVKLAKAAAKVDGNPLGGAAVDALRFEDGRMILAADPSKSVGYGEAMTAAGLSEIVATEAAAPGPLESIAEMVGMKKKAKNTHSAVFAEVKVDEELGVVRVTRIVCAVAAGRIVNPKTARSQILGGVVMGIGMALHEETLADHRIGRFMNHNFAEYHIPAHADVQDIEVIFVDEPDPEVSPLGIKGLGEIGIVGTAAAIGNAIFHATGKRVRSLPITIDKLLD